MAYVFSFEHYVLVELGLLMLAALFLFWRRPQRHLRLKMKSSSDNRKMAVTYHGGGASVSATRFERPDILNVHFNYNGHTFDAYEVLGLPAGSSWENVEKAYQIAADAADPMSRDFLQAALHAIERHVRGAA